MAVPQKVENLSMLRSIYTTCGHIPKICFILPPGQLFNHVFETLLIIFRNSKQPTVEISLNQRRHKENVVHLQNGILLFSLQIWEHGIWRQMDKTTEKKYHIEWYKSGQER